MWKQDRLANPKMRTKQKTTKKKHNKIKEENLSMFIYRTFSEAYVCILITNIFIDVYVKCFKAS